MRCLILELRLISTSFLCHIYFIYRYVCCVYMPYHTIPCHNAIIRFSSPLSPRSALLLLKEARVFRSNYCEVFDRLVEACRKRGGEHDTETLEAVVLMLVALTQAASADVRLAATLAGMEVTTSTAILGTRLQFV